MASDHITVLYGTLTARIDLRRNDWSLQAETVTEENLQSPEIQLTNKTVQRDEFTKLLERNARATNSLALYCFYPVWLELLELLDVKQPLPDAPVPWPPESNGVPEPAGPEVGHLEIAKTEVTKPDVAKPDAGKESANGKASPAASLTTPATEDVLSTEVVGSADSYRKQGQIFVSALAAIPTATLITTLIRAPGDAGLEEWKLAVGLSLAAVALAIGVWLALWLRAPVEISRQTLKDFPMHRVVGTGQRSYGEVLTRINELREKLAEADHKLPNEERRYRAVLATLRSVQLLATADALRSRVTDKKTQLLAAGALVAAGGAVFFLASTPKPKAPETAAAAPVVKVTLTEAGVKTLGCSKPTFDALKIGGTETEPQVVPLGQVTCTAGTYLTLPIAAKEALATDATPVKAPSKEPAATVSTPAAPTSTAPPATTAGTTSTAPAQTTTKP
jgi:hypothetical protein